MVFEAIGLWAGEWATVKVAEAVLQNVSSQFRSDDMQGVLKAATQAAQQQARALFYACPPDGPQGVPKFLEQFFQTIEVRTELQKPLQERGKPDVEVLVAAFAQQADAHPRIKAYKLAALLPWMTAFVERYFEQIQGIRFRVKKAEYLRQLAHRVDDVKFVGIAVPGEEVEKQEQLALIFVMPDVREERSPSRSSSVIDVEGLFDDGEGLFEELGFSKQQALLKEQRSWAMRDRSGRKLPAQQVLSQAKNKAVLLGAPGSGKTTLVSYFALMLAEQTQSDPAQIGFAPQADWLPMVIRIRDWILQPSQCLLTYLRCHAETSLAVKQLPEGFFEHWLERGRALILLDGLDEVVDEAQRRNIVEQIEAFLQQYGANPAIITSRPAGYRWDFFNLEAFPHYILEPFDEAQVDQFIDHWYSNRVPDKALAERRKTDLRRALKGNDRIRQLARNPLLLTIITLIHRYQAELPRQRYKLYEKAVETLLTSWDSGKEIKLYEQVLQYLRPDDLLYVLRKLAYWIHAQGNLGETEGGTLIDQEELIRRLSQEIRELKGCKAHEAKAEAERFVDFVQRRTGLLNEQGRERYGFVHKTFQEYLTAEEIYEQFDEGEEEIILEHIQQHLHQPHWREVLLLLVSKLKKKRAAEAIRRIYEAGSEYEQWLRRDLLLAGWCLTEDPQGLLGADGELAHQILDELVVLEVSPAADTGSKVKQSVAQILHRLGETAMETAAWERLQAKAEQINQFRLFEFQASLGQEEAVIAQLLALLQDPKSSLHGSAASILGQLGQGSEEVLTSLLALIQDSNSGMNWSAASALGKLGQGSEGVLTSLLALLRDPNPFMRGRAADAFGNLVQGSERVFTGLLTLLQDPNFSVRGRAASALGKLGQSSEEVLTGLLALLQDPNPCVRGRAADAFGKLGQGSEGVFTGLLTLLQDPNFSVRGRAASALGNLGQGSEEVLTGLLALLQDPYFSVRGRAASALGNLGQGSERVFTGLLTLLQDLNFSVRGRAASALGKLGQGSEEVLTGLLVLLQDPTSSVRGSAAEALGKLGQGSEEVLTGLLALLQDPDYFVCRRTAEALGNLGQGSEEVLTGLLALLQDPDSDVRVRAAEALVQLGQGSETVRPTLGQWLTQQPAKAKLGAAIDALGSMMDRECSIYPGSGGASTAGRDFSRW